MDLRKPLVHLHTQFNRDLPVGRDRHGLHEPPPVGARRPGVRVHPDPAPARPQDGRRPLAGPAGRGAPRLRGRGRPSAGTSRTGSGSRGSATTCARSPSPTATRSRRRPGLASRSTATASPTSSSASRRSPSPTSTASSDYERTLRLARALAALGRRPPRRAADGRADRGRPAVVPGGRRVRRVHRHVRGPGRAPRSCPGIGVQRLMADGYGFGAEGDWKAAALVRILKVDGRRAARRHVVHGGLHLPPGRPGPRGARRPHARGLPLDRRRAAVVRDPPAVDRRPGGPGAAGVRRRARAGASSSASPTSATASGSSPTRWTSSSPTQPLPRLPVARAVWRPRPDLPTAAEAWLTAGGPHHTALTTTLSTLRRCTDFAEMAGIELRDHRRRDDLAPRSGASSAGTRRSTSSSAGRERAGGGTARPARPSRSRPSCRRPGPSAGSARSTGRTCR